MTKLGMVGGTGPESTLMYYREIAVRFQKRHPNGAFPALTIETVNMYEMLGYAKSGDFDALERYLGGAVRNLEAAGAELVILTANVAHVVFDRLQRNTRTPLLSILEPTCQEINKRSLGRIALIGTGFTMSQPYFKEAFFAQGIEAVIPNAEERAVIDDIIARELEFGIVNESSKALVDAIIDRLIAEEGAQGVVLGCTELPLMYGEALLPAPVFDTMQLHIESIVDRMLEESREG